MKYKIFAGLGGGFGGATYQYTEDFASEEAAEAAAYTEAREIYDSYSGMHGLANFEAYLEAEGIEDFDEMDAQEQAGVEEGYEQYENEDFESWADYRVEKPAEDVCPVCGTKMEYCESCSMWNCYTCDAHGQCLCS